MVAVATFEVDQIANNVVVVATMSVDCNNCENCDHITPSKLIL